MRLVCPNCGAQYDVPVEVIPEAGRDVQCSNCGHTWFQKRVSPGSAAPSEPAPIPEPMPETMPDPIPESPDPGPPETELRSPKKSIDPEMAELFREEREFEARQRAAEGLETQPDLGLEPPAEDEKARRTRESRERMAQIKGEEIAQGAGRSIPPPLRPMPNFRLPPWPQPQHRGANCCPMWTKSTRLCAHRLSRA